MLLIFKGIFPKQAYAISSLNACAAKPECVAVLGSELAPAISAPTGAGFGASTLSTTTAAGATTSSVQAVARVAVIAATGAYSVGGWHYWNEVSNEQAQNKAKERYCQSHANIVACGGKPKPTATAWFPNTITFTKQSDGRYYLYGKWITPNCTASPNYASALGYFTNPYLLFVDFSPVPGCVGQIAVEGDPTLWKNWSQDLRNQAVKSLTPSDWQNLITSMPEGGKLNPKDKVKAPIIVIPGQEADDPKTPEDERILKKVPGFFTWPGLPDFDKDKIPDETDPDDDNDGTPDSSDPDPHNPSVPTASSSPPPEPSSNQSSGSEEATDSQPTDDDMWSELDEYNNPTPEISPEARAIANGHAYDEHIGDFPGIETRDEFAQLIDDVINNPSEVKPLSRGRTAYWDDTSDTVVIVDPGDADSGTAFKPTGGKDYFDTLE